MEFDFSSLPIKIDFVRATQRDEWKCDQWEITFTSKSGRWVTDYFTGVGHRNKWGKPVKPSVADVLQALILEAYAADQSFSDWCAEYGYSDDSLKALNTYKQCCEIATMLRKHIGRDALEKARSALEGM